MIIDRENGIVATTWHIDDIRNVISSNNINFKKGKELTDDECFNVLETAVRKHDAEIGINWDVLDEWIRILYGDRMDKAEPSYDPSYVKFQTGSGEGK